MHFASLSALLLLPLLYGLIVLLYALKPRRRDVVVSSTFLWQQAMRDAQADAPFQKLRAYLLLILQALIATLLVFALAHPYIFAQTVAGSRIALVVDTSASMQTTDITPSRLEAAKQEARKIVDGMGAGDQTLLLSTADRPQALTGFTDNKAELRRAIDNVKPHDTPANMRDALQLAVDLISSQGSELAGRIELISDGAFENNFKNTVDSASGNSRGAGSKQTSAALAGLRLGNVSLQFHPVGKGSDNIGLGAANYRHGLNGDASGQLLVGTRNFSSQTKTFTEEISIEGQLYDAHEITLPAGGEHTEVLDVPEPQEAVTARIRLDVKDDLAADNEAWLVLHRRKRLNVLLVGQENVWLENALRVDADVVLSKAPAYPGERAKAYDVIVFNEQAPAHLPPGNYLFLHCGSDQCPAVIQANGGRRDNITVVDTEPGHPALRYVDFGSAKLMGVYKATPLDWGQEIASGETRTADCGGREKRQTRRIFVNFSLNKSPGFLLTVAFPIFISDSARWLGRDETNTPSQLRAEDITPHRTLARAGANRPLPPRPQAWSGQNANSCRILY